MKGPMILDRRCNSADRHPGGVSLKSLPGALPLALLCSCAASSSDPKLSCPESALTADQCSTFAGQDNRVLTQDTITGQPIADVALASADFKIDCAAGSPPGENWVSGSGWITGANGS